LSLSTDQASYAPGDEVEFSVLVKEDGKTVSEDAYVSVSATDSSVFAQLSKKQQPANLAAQVLLEHEIFQTNYEWDYSSNYVNHFYGIDAEDSADTNLELLLGVQQWRYCVFCPETILRNKQGLEEMDDEEKVRIMTLYAIGDQNQGADWAEDDMVMEMMPM
jgi:hypothetical protein